MSVTTAQTFDLVYRSANPPNRRYLLSVVKRLKEKVENGQSIDDDLQEMISSAEQWNAFVDRVSAYAGDADAPQLVDKMIADLFWYHLHPAVWQLFAIKELSRRQSLADLENLAESMRRAVAEVTHRLVLLDQSRSSQILS